MLLTYFIHFGHTSLVEMGRTLGLDRYIQNIFVDYSTFVLYSLRLNVYER